MYYSNIYQWLRHLALMGSIYVKYGKNPKRAFQKMQLVAKGDFTPFLGLRARLI